MSEQAPAAILARLENQFAGLPQGEPALESGQETQVAESVEAEAEAADDGYEDHEWGGIKARLPKPWKEALLRNEDYTRKTQEIGEQRKSLEQVQSVAELQRREQDFMKSVESERFELHMHEQYLKQFSSLPWQTMSTEEIMRNRIEMDRAKDKRAELAESITSKHRKYMEELQARLGDLRGKTRELASKSIQGFSEETEKTIRAFAKSEGLADREIDNVLLDPRSLKILWKASQFDKIKAGTTQAGESAERVLRPGTAARTMPKETVDKLNFGKAMSKAKTSGQKAALIEEKLARTFDKGRR